MLKKSPLLLYFNLILVLLCSLLTAACQPPPAEEADSDYLSGYILIWHSWEETEDIEALDLIFDQFMTLHPDVTIVSSSVPDWDLEQRYERTASLGLGPDLFIGSSPWISRLADDGLIRDISDREINMEIFFPGIINNVAHNEGVYGFPISLQPPGLYYNRSLVELPARSLTDLLAEAREGRWVAIDTNFLNAYWGMSLFGAPIFNDAGELANDTAGFVAWLDWLHMAQNESQGIVLSQDTEKLQQLFQEGQVAYYIGPYNMLDEFTLALSEDENIDTSTLGVTSLPQQEREVDEQRVDPIAGSIRPIEPINTAGPLVPADVIMFNHASSDNQYKISLTLAEFMTNVQQSTSMMRNAGRIPANRNVRINPVIYPDIFWFSRQAYTAVNLPKSFSNERLQERGNAVYTAVLSGAKSPEVAVCEFVVDLSTEPGTPPDFAPCEAQAAEEEAADE